VLVGDGPQSAELKDLAVRLKLNNVDFVGPQWGENLNRLLKRTRFVVIPSVWHENFPYVILQSFAMGKAVIGTDRGGIPELIGNNERGLIYPARDERALAESIHELWLDPGLAVQMGERAKKYADEQFNDRMFYDCLIRNYKEILQ
jgi:glycosyltransferase involved in cell wall biosynthesis